MRVHGCSFYACSACVCSVYPRLWLVYSMLAYWVGCRCRRDSFVGARKTKTSGVVELPPAAVRRSRRIAPITTRLGAYSGLKDMSDDGESATTQTSDDYSQG